MKKLVLVSLKTFAFFVGWAICVSILPIPDTKSAAVWRFWAELIPLLSVIGFTIIFWLIDKRNIRLHYAFQESNSVGWRHYADEANRVKAK